MLAAMPCLPACHDRGGRVPSSLPVVSDTSHRGAPTIDEALAYRRGREREITIARAALARAVRTPAGVHQPDLAVLPDLMAREGAAAAGLDTDRYRRVVTRVDSLLRDRESQTSDDRPSGPRPEWMTLDSLRVELAVLRSRLAAVTGGTE